MSINVCTDQLAMMLAAPGQLVSVSHLAADPRTSSMPAAAEAFPVNYGRAEEVYLLEPDLVLAGRYTTGPTVDMLRRLGIEVVLFDPATSLADVRDRIARVGAALGRDAAARALTAQFDAALAGLRDPGAERPRAALYFANGYTTGDRTLGGDILDAAGFDNIAAEAGISHGGTLPLELLALADPDAIITGVPYPGGSRAEDILSHPVLDDLRGRSFAGAVTDPDWLCGTPHVLRAIDGLRDMRRAAETGE